MEPNTKLEQQIKEKLAERTLQPSPMAWDRLDAMLTVAEEKQAAPEVKKKPRRDWLWAAAVCSGFLMMGAVMLNAEKENKGNIIINEEDTFVAAPLHDTTTQKSNNMPAAQGETNTGVTVISHETATVQANEHATAQKAGVKANQGGVATGIATMGKANSTKVMTDNTAGNSKTSFTTDNSAVATATPEQTSGISVNSGKLLAAVEGEANTGTSNAKPAKTSVKVDSNSLLSSVEGELNESFRSRVLNSAIKNYNAVKTSVANRNYQ